MSKFNTSTSHPLIPNSQEYLLKKKFISIHSEDRDVVKYPNSSEFEIELPQDYLNVQGVRLSTWSFPSNYSVFSSDQNNITLMFQITDAYNPGEHGLSNDLQNAIFSALYYNYGKNFTAIIEEGFYNPHQIATELTNKMNAAVYIYILDYLIINDPSLINSFVTYNQFVVAYNEVNQQLWFGNKSSAFEIVNDMNNDFKQINNLQENINLCKGPGSRAYKEFVNWGLPSYLGFDRISAFSMPQNSIPQVENTLITLPRFYYGDALKSGDNGYWILPDPSLPGAIVNYLKAPFKINILGNAYFYMEIDNLNNLDETMPYSLSPFTQQTNKTNGIANSAFAKIAIPTTPLSQWFDNSMDSYMLFQPPAERIRKIKLRLRYHNGTLVNFGLFEYSFTLEFTIFDAQINKKTNMYVPETVSTFTQR